MTTDLCGCFGVVGQILCAWQMSSSIMDAGDKSPLQDLLWGGLKLGSLQVTEAASANAGHEHDSANLPAAVVRHTCQNTSILAGLR